MEYSRAARQDYPKNAKCIDKIANSPIGQNVDKRVESIYFCLKRLISRANLRQYDYGISAGIMFRGRLQYFGNKCFFVALAGAALDARNITLAKGSDYNLMAGSIMICFYAKILNSFPELAGITYDWLFSNNDTDSLVFDFEAKCPELYRQVSKRAQEYLAQNYAHCHIGQKFFSNNRGGDESGVERGVAIYELFMTILGDICEVSPFIFSPEYLISHYSDQDNEGVDAYLFLPVIKPRIGILDPVILRLSSGHYTFISQYSGESRQMTYKQAMDYLELSKKLNEANSANSGFAREANDLVKRYQKYPLGYFIRGSDIVYYRKVHGPDHDYSLNQRRFLADFAAENDEERLKKARQNAQ